MAERLAWFSAVTDLDLLHLGTQADADTIKDTAVAQPLLVAGGVLGALSLFPHPADGHRSVAFGAGHSVGEITAAIGSGALRLEAALVLVRERGRAMAAAAKATATGMTAVLGGERDVVLASIAKHGLTAANDNGPGQIVAAGTVEQLVSFAADPPKGARLRALSVAGAFHTEHMAPAVDVLAKLARGITVADARTPLISNADGSVIHSGREYLARLVAQVAKPVRWDLVMKTMEHLGVTAVIEVPPAGTLTGIIKRAMPGVETLALKTPDDLPAARDLIARHGQASSTDTSPSWRLLVAPVKGIFHRHPNLDPAIGTRLEPGQPIGVVRTNREEVAVLAPSGGDVVEWVVTDGDPVSPGQPLVRLHPIPGEDSIDSDFGSWAGLDGATEMVDMTGTEPVASVGTVATEPGPRR